LLFFLILFSCLNCVFGIGILKRSNMFRIGSVVVCLLGSIFCILFVPGFLDDAIGLSLLFMSQKIVSRFTALVIAILQIIIVIALLRKETKELFTNKAGRNPAE
jgi:hypothetical protein